MTSHRAPHAIAVVRASDGMIRTSRRKVGVAAFFTLLFALLPFAAAGTAQAITLPPHGHVYNSDSPRCLDSGTTKGALLFTCSNSIYQYWVLNRSHEIVGTRRRDAWTTAPASTGAGSS